MSPNRTTRHEAIDVWRGVACLMVVIDHAAVNLAWVDAEVAGPEGWLRWLVVGATRLALGPSLFFVLSGFCVAASVESSRRKGTTPLAFLSRRFWRIVPTYWVALLGFVVAVAACDALGLAWLHGGGRGLALASPGDLSWGQWFGNITLTETWRHAYLPGAGQENVFTRIAWTLCYQEQFYAISALVWVLSPRRWFRGLAVATGLILACRVVLWDSGRLPQIDGLFPIYWQEFAVGLAVYWRLSRAETTGERLAVDVGLVGLVGLGLWVQFASTAVAAGFGLTLIGLRGRDATIAGARWLDPIRACGRRCFSIYLVHLPICSMGSVALDGLGLSGFWSRAMVVIPTVTAIALVASWAFHAAIESKFIGRPDLAGIVARFASRMGGHRGGFKPRRMLPYSTVSR